MHLFLPDTDATEALGQALAGVAHAALDLSDGLTGDLGHILGASGVGAELRLADLPVAPALASLPEAERLTCLLSGGDDYELLFTAPVSARDAVRAAALASGTAVSGFQAEVPAASSSGGSITTRFTGRMAEFRCRA